MAGALRVLCVNPGLNLGGAEHSLLLLLQGLRARGVSATVALFGPGAFQDRLGALGIPTVIVRSPRAFRRVSRYRSPRTFAETAVLGALSLAVAVDVARLARRAGAHLIHTNGPKAHLIGGLAGRLLRLPVVWHVRDFPPPGATGRIFKRAARILPSLVLANSDAVRSAIDDGGVNVARIYNPIDLQQFNVHRPRAKFRAELGVHDSTPIVGMVAHLTPWKGHELFLRIARGVADRVPDCRFVVAGGAIYETEGHGGYRDELLSLSASLGLDRQVTFLGARQDMPDVMAALDVLLHCPRAPEPFGRNVAEAMAAGRPVVAARCGGLAEVIGDNVAGLLVEPDDLEGFIAAVAHLLGDSALRRRLGLAGRQRAEALFDAEDHACRVLTAYKAILPAGRRQL